MATQRKRTVKVDKATAAKMSAESKEAKMDEAYEAPIPTGDGLEHSAWPAEARKLALLRMDPEYLGKSQQELADACGYSLRSVNRYFNDPAFNAYCDALAAQALRSDGLLAETVASIRKGLRAGNMNAAQLVLKAKGMLREVRETKSDVTVTDKRDSNDVLDDEIARLERETGVDKRTVN